LTKPKELILLAWTISTTCLKQLHNQSFETQPKQNPKSPFGWGDFSVGKSTL